MVKKVKFRFSNDKTIYDLNMSVPDFKKTDENVEKAIRWLLYENMDNSNPDKVLTIYINSTGGSLTDAFGLIDVMQNSSFVVRTIGIGNIMSSAFLIFAAGDKGERYIAKNISERNKNKK